MASRVPKEQVMLIPTAIGGRLVEWGEAWTKRRSGMALFTRSRRTIYLDDKSYVRITGGHWSNGQWECVEEPESIFRLCRND